VALAAGVATLSAVVAASIGLGGAASAAPALDLRPHTVYTSTNSATGNQVLELRSRGGRLTQVAAVSTGGKGTGGGLGSQGAVVLDGDRLFTVDAGSNDVAVFAVRGDGDLRLLDRAPSGGLTPVSLSVHGDIVAVLNAGDESVTTLRVHGSNLEPVAGSHQVLAGAGGAEVSFDRSGRRVVVTEKATSDLVVLPVRHGVLGSPVVSPSEGVTPFGFAIDRHDHVIVTNANGGAAGASSVSSYSIGHDGALHAVSAAVPTTQTAACWLAVSTDGRFAYDTNAGSGTISRYAIGHDGSITLVDAVAASPGAGPVDLVATPDSLFTLNGGSHTISLHAIAADGSLAAVTAVAVPVGATGLAAG